MALPVPVNQTLNISEARQRFSQLLNQVFHRKTRILLEKNGIPVAAIISAADFERFMQLEARRNEHFKVLDELQSSFEDVPEEELAHEIMRARTLVRQEQGEQAPSI
ncbi:MAG: type II toxin-antitoxin system prevent-host-death family antitoxin [Herpetosiphonaceae bacterium]|nr:type II toxin-antitoxin system prevent-host-death family antitoxin [Herpetosiphonaceae bacterium]